MNKRLRVVFGDVTLGVAGENFHAIFSYATGGLESLCIGGREWLYRTMKPTFWRAITDNDRGCGFHLKSGMWLAADMFLRNAGVDVKVDGKTVSQLRGPENNIWTGDETAERVEITFHYATITVPSTQVHVTYAADCGRIRVTAAYEGREGLPQLPAFGMRMIMPTRADGYRWDGLSGETYPDRKAGAKPGVYEAEGLPVTPYLVPQECGMHMDTHWVEVTRSSVQDNAARNPAPFTLKIAEADAPFHFSCLPYTAEELENATHREELPLPRRTVLCVYGAVRGVGGINSWGADVEEAYHISAEKDIVFSFDLMV